MKKVQLQAIGVSTLESGMRKFAIALGSTQRHLVIAFTLRMAQTCGSSRQTASGSRQSSTRRWSWVKTVARSNNSLHCKGCLPGYTERAAVVPNHNAQIRLVHTLQMPELMPQRRQLPLVHTNTQPSSEHQTCIEYIIYSTPNQS